MILSTLHHRKEHPTTRVPTSHAFTHPDEPLRQDTATNSSQSSSCNNLLPCDSEARHIRETKVEIVCGEDYFCSCQSFIPFHTSNIETRTEI